MENKAIWSESTKGNSLRSYGYGISNDTVNADDFKGIKEIFEDVNKPFFVLNKDENLYISTNCSLNFGGDKNSEGYSIAALVPAVPLNSLGDESFIKEYGLKYAYVGGSMAHGIASTDLAIALGRSGILGFVGSAGESPEKVEKDILTMKDADSKGKVSFGFNLIHSPSESGLEDKIVDLFIKHEVRVIEASAFLNLTLPLVRYRVTGIYRDQTTGKIIVPNKVIAKVSRVEVASKFMAPPPENMLKKLVEQGVITEQQAELARHIPVAGDVTSEADSGGHTDNRPAVCLHPTMVALKNRMQNEYKYETPLRVGFGGGIGSPASAAAAFAMGAAYIVLGSVHQACLESGQSMAGKQLLANAQQADTAMAPAGDMFEMGVTVQVLKRGTMFAMRASKLYEFYRKYTNIDQLTPSERTNLEKNILQDSFDNIWKGTADFFSRRDPSQIAKAEADPHHKMALVFRWYLGLSSRWAMTGDQSRRMDYQIWCGPAMGSFNEWTKGSHLEKPENRHAYEVAMNMLYGAAVEMRLNSLRSQGIKISSELSSVRPFTLDIIEKNIQK